MIPKRSFCVYFIPSSIGFPLALCTPKTMHSPQNSKRQKNPDRSHPSFCGSGSTPYNQLRHIPATTKVAPGHRTIVSLFRRPCTPNYASQRSPNRRDASPSIAVDAIRTLDQSSCFFSMKKVTERRTDCQLSTRLTNVNLRSKRQTVVCQQFETNEH